MSDKEIRLDELNKMWDANSNICVLDKDDTVATLTVKLARTNYIIAKRIKDLKDK